jgi:hypothetical protein
MIRAFLASFLALGFVAVAPAFAADDAYTIKLYKAKKGDKTENEKTEDGKNNISITVMGMNMKQEVASGKKEIYTEEILEKKDGDRKATKLARTYASAEKSEKDETTKFAYAGETVLIEKKGDKYEFSVKGKALKEDEAPDLYKSFNKAEDEPQSEDFLSKDPVKVGETWKLPADKSEKIFKTLGDEKMKLDAKKSNISGKLLKAYKKEGAQFGTLEITIEVFVTEIDLGGEFAKTKAGSKMTIKATIDTCIDGTVNFEDGKMEVNVDLTADLPNDGSFSITGKSSGIEKTRAAKK